MHHARQPLKSYLYNNQSDVLRDEIRNAGAFEEIADEIIRHGTPTNQSAHMDFHAQSGELLEALMKKNYPGDLFGVERDREKIELALRKLSPVALFNTSVGSVSILENPNATIVPCLNDDAQVRARLVQEDFCFEPRVLAHLLGQSHVDSASFVLSSISDMPLVDPLNEGVIQSRQKMKQVMTFSYMSSFTSPGGSLARAELADFRPGSEPEFIPKLQTSFLEKLQPYWMDIEVKILTADVHNAVAASDWRLGRGKASVRHGILLLLARRTDKPAGLEVFEHFEKAALFT